MKCFICGVACEDSEDILGHVYRIHRKGRQRMVQCYDSECFCGEPMIGFFSWLDHCNGGEYPRGWHWRDAVVAVQAHYADITMGAKEC